MTRFGWQGWAGQRGDLEELEMLDVLLVFTALVFFGITGLYTYGCGWLIRDTKTAERGERFETLGDKLAGEG